MRRKRVRKLPHPEDLEALGFVLELLAHPNEGAARGLCRPLSFAEAVAMLEEEAATPGISLGDIETRLPVATEAYIKRLQRLRKQFPTVQDLRVFYEIVSPRRRGRPPFGKQASTLEKLRPWEKLGVSRPTWFRNRRRYVVLRRMSEAATPGE